MNTRIELRGPLEEAVQAFAKKDERPIASAIRVLLREALNARGMLPAADRKEKRAT